MSYTIDGLHPMPLRYCFVRTRKGNEGTSKPLRSYFEATICLTTVSQVFGNLRFVVE